MSAAGMMNQGMNQGMGMGMNQGTVHLTMQSLDEMRMECGWNAKPPFPHHYQQQNAPLPTKMHLHLSVKRFDINANPLLPARGTSYG